MSGFPTDLLVYGAVALMILLFNFLGRKRAAQQVPPAQDPGEDEALRESVLYEPDEPVASAAEYWGRLPPTQTVYPVAQEPAVQAERPRVRVRVPRAMRRYDRASLFGSKADVRKAIVLMTVLGPPRGAERPDDAFRR